MSTIPFYRLRSLIEEKYGAERFDFGCQIVARWLSFETKIEITEMAVKTLCDEESENIETFFPRTSKALINLFHLQSAKELYTFPETFTQNNLAQ